MNIQVIKDEFKKHYKKYDINEPAIIRKYYHSIRVMDLSRLIAKYNNFNDNDAEIAAVVGLLHDYSRFEQWTDYKSFNDFDSVDHGDLAVQRLFDEQEIKNYSLKEENYDEIYDAIKYHNKLSIPDNLTEHNTLLCKVIRDADKLDLFYLFGINQALFSDDDSDISFDVNEQFFKESQIKTTTVKNNNELIILRLAMIYDLNFDYSFKYIKDNNLLWRLFDNIKNKEKFIKYFAYVDKYIEERMNKSGNKI